MEWMRNYRLFVGKSNVSLHVLASVSYSRKKFVLHKNAFITINTLHHILIANTGVENHLLAGFLFHGLGSRSRE
jgi:hypothetical protein